MIKLAITDDHPSVTEGIKSMFKNNADITLTAIYYDAKTTLAEIVQSKADVLLLDINLPDMDGILLCKEVLSILPKIKIIGFTSYMETSFVKSLMGNGAVGFLLKNSSSKEIIEAIKVVCDGEEFIQQELKNLLVAESLKQKPRRSFLPKLTRREKEILALILDEMTTQEIAEKLFISPKTVETHRLNLLQKLEVKNTAGLVKVTVERGLL